MTYMPSPGDSRPHTVTLIPGDGIGPEVTSAVIAVVEALKAPIVWERFDSLSGSTADGAPPTAVPADVLASIRRNGVCLKGTLYTPLSKKNTSTQSLNVQLRKDLDLVVNLVRFLLLFFAGRGAVVLRRQHGKKMPRNPPRRLTPKPTKKPTKLNGQHARSPRTTPSTTTPKPKTTRETKTTKQQIHGFSIPGVKGVRHGDELDIVVVRENTEGEYSGLEHEVVDGVVESLKVITEEKSLRTAEYAFEFAFLVRTDCSPPPSRKKRERRLPPPFGPEKLKATTAKHSPPLTIITNTPTTNNTPPK